MKLPTVLFNFDKCFYFTDVTKVNVIHWRTDRPSNDRAVYQNMTLVNHGTGPA